MGASLKRTFWATGLVGTVILVGVVLSVMGGAYLGKHPKSGHPGAADLEDGDSEATATEPGPLPVQTIRPRCDPSFTLSIKAPAQVESYEWADLKAQVAGKVAFIRKAEGARVTAGEVLLRIAVPDLDEEVNQKEAVVRQRQAELRVAQANERIASAGVDVAAKGVEVVQAALGEAQATQDYRGKELRRYRGLIAERAANQEIVDETERYYQAAVAATAKAQADILKTQMSLTEARAKLDAAKADVQLKEEMIEVAQRDKDRSQALADYAKITAPFDGVITRRTVNRGSFVHNAATAHSEPLLRVERRDIVTVTMKVSDEFAPLVDNDTEAVIEMSELPGQEIHGKVTRFSPTLESATNDHTLPVQVDLFNGTEEEYQRFLTQERLKKEPFDDLKEGSLPLVPKITGNTEGGYHPLIPKMVGDMRLVFRHLRNVFLLPSDAIVREGGTPYIYVVKDCKAVRLPVEVQVDDQKLAKVAIIQKTTSGVVKRDLTGKEEVIYSNQTELSPGESVQPLPVDWKP
jgi:multidrug efflux pump subunit AcrA (membrane-fusion protein)